LHYDIFLEGIKYDDINKTREGLVLELYNQGKTYREISKEARISPRDIGVILNKVKEGKKAEGLKEEEINKICKHLLPLIQRLMTKLIVW
jgi:DNA invertase Pin-like site-specific DNA recombinase